MGLVLGGGGTAGLAHLAGALLALQQDLRWDPAQADVIVGTSAGSIAGTLLRAGLTVDDLAAWSSEVAPLDTGRAHRDFLEQLADSPMRLRWPVPRSPFETGRLLADLTRGRIALGAAVLSALPFGPLDAGCVLERLGELTTSWPGSPLWIPAVRMADGHRVVFGRDRDAPLGKAVAASCAIPGLYRPVSIAGRRYLDGGAHSSTNADLIADAGVELAIVIAPMSTDAWLPGLRPDRLVRNGAHARLRRECESLRRRGIDTAVFEPDAASRDAMGINLLDRARTGRVVTAAFLGTGRQIAPPLRERFTARRPVSGAAA